MSPGSSCGGKVTARCSLTEERGQGQPRGLWLRWHPVSPSPLDEATNEDGVGWAVLRPGVGTFSVRANDARYFGDVEECPPKPPYPLDSSIEHLQGDHTTPRHCFHYCKAAEYSPKGPGSWPALCGWSINPLVPSGSQIAGFEGVPSLRLVSVPTAHRRPCLVSPQTVACFHSFMHVL